MFTPECLKKDAKLMADYIKASGIQYDYIACRGISGIVFGTALSMVTGKGIAAVRKPNDDTHAKTLVEFNEGLSNPTHKYIIVDDFVASGATARSIIEVMRGHGLCCAGMFCYHTDGDPIQCRSDITPDTPELPIVYCMHDLKKWLAMVKGIYMPEPIKPLVQKIIKVFESKLKRQAPKKKG
jgi:hypothetical protein